MISWRRAKRAAAGQAGRKKSSQWIRTTSVAPTGSHRVLPVASDVTRAPLASPVARRRGRRPPRRVAGQRVLHVTGAALHQHPAGHRSWREEHRPGLAAPVGRPWPAGTTGSVMTRGIGRAGNARDDHEAALEAPELRPRSPGDDGRIWSSAQPARPTEVRGRRPADERCPGPRGHDGGVEARGRSGWHRHARVKPGARRRAQSGVDPVVGPARSAAARPAAARPGEEPVDSTADSPSSNSSVATPRKVTAKPSSRAAHRTGRGSGRCRDDPT